MKCNIIIIKSYILLFYIIKSINLKIKHFWLYNCYKWKRADKYDHILWKYVNWEEINVGKYLKIAFFSDTTEKNI